ncbi:MAG: hypothetical protein HC780_23365 [Leptolyngbyaceae cyanobacterium CSU_1_3]|nr:hypothetical protein [Leptolyngbyaceae cyanobacterium CSU_1_3]
MSSNVLTQDFRQQLEQQRDRLTHERSAIVQAVIDQATAAIDRSLDHINALLGNLAAVPSTTSLTNGSIQTSPIAELETPSLDSQSPTPKRRSTQKATAAALKSSNAIAQMPDGPAKQVNQRKAAAHKASSSAAKPSAKNQSSVMTKSAPISQSKGKAKSDTRKAFEAPKLKREFQDLTLAQAIERVMMQATERTFTTDEMIQTIYGALDESILPRTRQSVALTFAHGIRRKDYIKVQENPAQYQVNPERKTEA